jgi:hypothetical protein
VKHDRALSRGIVFVVDDFLSIVIGILVELDSCGIDADVSLKNKTTHIAMRQTTIDDYNCVECDCHSFCSRVPTTNIRHDISRHSLSLSSQSRQAMACSIVRHTFTFNVEKNVDRCTFDGAIHKARMAMLLSTRVRRALFE